MKMLAILGIPIGIAVLFIGLKLSSDNLGMFVDSTSAFIVIGGTFAASVITFRLDRIFVLFKIFLRHVMGADHINYAGLIKQIIVIGEAYRKGESLEGQLSKIKDPFLKEALTMIADGALDHESIVEILEGRNENISYIRMEEANKMKVLGQFPPAFGMMGTTIGMIVLLSNLGGADAIKIIGPAMSVCLITTLYGVIIANLGFIPISENLIESTKQETLKNDIVVEGIRLLLKKTNPILVAERLNSFLIPSERLDWKQALGK